MEQHKHYRNKNGFTSLELLMVMGLIAILAVGSISLWRNNKNRIAFEETKKNVLLALEKARSRAETGFQNDPNSKCYGVRRDSGNKIIISERCGTDCDIDCGDSIDVYLPASVNDFSVKFRRIDAWADTDTDITFPTNSAKISVKQDGRIIEN